MLGLELGTTYRPAFSHNAPHAVQLTKVSWPIQATLTASRSLKAALCSHQCAAWGFMGCPGAQLQMVAATLDGVSRSGDGMFKAQSDTSGRVSSSSRGLQQQEA